MSHGHTDILTPWAPVGAKKDFLFPELMFNTAHMIIRSHPCSPNNVTWSRAETGDQDADEARMMSAGVLSVNISPITGLSMTMGHTPGTPHTRVAPDNRPGEAFTKHFLIQRKSMRGLRRYTSSSFDI